MPPITSVPDLPMTTSPSRFGLAMLDDPESMNAPFTLRGFSSHSVMKPNPFTDGEFSVDRLSSARTDFLAGSGQPKNPPHLRPNPSPSLAWLGFRFAPSLR